MWGRQMNLLRFKSSKSIATSRQQHQENWILLLRTRQSDLTNGLYVALAPLFLPGAGSR